MSPVDIEEKPINSELIWLNQTAQLLDNRFRIPGTQYRFGLDGIVGLVPYVGDLLTILVGGVMVIIMYRKGASGKLTFRMIMNLLLDAVMGTIPFIGDIFDFSYRSHARNVNLMIEHYEEGKHRGNAWPAVILILVVIVALIVFSIYVSAKILSALINVIQAI